MAYRISLQWKIITELTAEGAVALYGSPRLFNFKGGIGFLRSIGGRIRTECAPVVLEPTDVFHQGLTNLRTALKISGCRFPYQIETSDGTGKRRLNATFHLHGRALCISVSFLDDLEVSATSDISNLQRLETHLSLSQLINQIVAIVITGNRRAKPLGSLPKYYPLVHIVSLGDDAPDWRRDLVELVTRHAMPNGDVVRAVLEKNRRHQVDDSLLLIDKQGIAAYVPVHAGPTIRGSLQRFGNAASMLELAAVLRLQLSKQSIDLASDVLSIITHADDAITESVSAQRTWVLVVDEFRLQLELGRAGPRKSITPQQRILLVTATRVESNAALRAVALETGRSAIPVKIDGYVYQHLGQVAASDIWHAISEMGTGGVGGSQESVRKAIAAVKPDAVLMVGIAFGIDSKKFAIGDILVSKQLLLYDLQRINSDSTITLRGDTAPASPKLLNWVRNAELHWASIGASRVEAGLLLSGDKLVDNKDYRNELECLVPDALGGEMEGAGLYVSCMDAKVDWILVKAICDWADGNKRRNKSVRQQKAASNAIAFVLQILKSA